MSVGFTSLAQRLLAAESDSYRGGVACSTQLVSENQPPLGRCAIESSTRSDCSIVPIASATLISAIPVVVFIPVCIPIAPRHCLLHVTLLLCNRAARVEWSVWYIMGDDCGDHLQPALSNSLD